MTQAQEEKIRELAYFNWINRGSPNDDPQIDWYAAVAILEGKAGTGENVLQKKGSIKQKPQVLHATGLLKKKISNINNIK